MLVVLKQAVAAGSIALLKDESGEENGLKNHRAEENGLRAEENGLKKERTLLPNGRLSPQWVTASSRAGRL